ncbi:hypothetical protein TNCV_164451 [Trichonephila clavipes]|nr:hypothetical protein TNCV_164451 [Trichonephila clavipes]
MNKYLLKSQYKATQTLLAECPKEPSSPEKDLARCYNAEEDTLDLAPRSPNFDTLPNEPATVAEWSRYRIAAGLVTRLSPVPLKSRRVGERCTLNLSRAETSSHSCDVEKEGVQAQVSSTSLDHGSKLRGPSPKSSREAEQCDVNIHTLTQSVCDGLVIMVTNWYTCQEFPNSSTPEGFPCRGVDVCYIWGSKSSRWHGVVVWRVVCQLK